LECTPRRSRTSRLNRVESNHQSHPKESCYETLTPADQHAPSVPRRHHSSPLPGSLSACPGTRLVRSARRLAGANVPHVGLVRIVRCVFLRYTRRQNGSRNEARTRVRTDVSSLVVGFLFELFAAKMRPAHNCKNVAFSKNSRLRSSEAKNTPPRLEIARPPSASPRASPFPQLLSHTTSLSFPGSVSGPE